MERERRRYSDKQATATRDRGTECRAAGWIRREVSRYCFIDFSINYGNGPRTNVLHRHITVVRVCELRTGSQTMLAKRKWTKIWDK